MRRTRYLLLLLALYIIFIGGTSRYQTLYQVRVLHHIVVTSILSLWLIYRICSKGLPSTPLNRPLFALIVVWFVSAITSLDPRIALEHIWFPFTYIVVFFIIVDFFQRGRGKLIMETFFFVATLVVFVTLLEFASWYFGLGILPNTSVGWYEAGIIIPPNLPKVSLAMGITTLVAGFTVPVIFVCATWAMTVRHSANRRILWVITFLLFLTLVLTFSRGGLLAFIAGFATFILIRAIQHPRLLQHISPKAIGSIGGIVAGGILIAFVAITLPFAIGRSDEGRLDMWRSAVDMTIDHPITGVGPGLFGRAYRSYRDPIVGRDKLAAAHNAYLNLASEVGIIGIVVGAWLAFTILKTSWQIWQNAKGRNQHLRVEGMFVALVALAVHSLVDVFTITPINIVLIVIVAYLVTGHRSILDPIPHGKIYPSYALLGITLIFGFILLNWDRAQGLYQASFGKPTDEALNLVKQAQEIDPYLNLYHLHEAFLLGNSANDTDSIETAIHAYETALQLEPTWDIGWINLASLELKRNRPDLALEYLQTATEIYPYNSANFAFARIAEQENLAEPDTIINFYQQAQSNLVYLPIAQVWWSTPLITQATEQYTGRRNTEIQYRVFRIHRPELAESLIPQTPETASDWWITAQHALTQNNLQTAQDAINRAIELNPNNGDYYVTRALTQLDQPELVKQDIRLAKLYRTRYEYPDTILAQIAETESEAISIKANALPQRTIGQEFSAILYTRPAIFDVPIDMRFPGLGESIIEPWHDVADSFIAKGETAQAIRAFQFIIENAPYDQYAYSILNQLLGD